MLILSQTSDTEIDTNTVGPILAKHHAPGSGGNGPSWLTFLDPMKDSLWSVDLFRCASITLERHGVLLVMDQFSRRVIECGV